MTKNLEPRLILCALLCGAIGIAALSGCATRGADPTTQYDFGSLPANATVARKLPPLSIADINAPAWLDNTLMFYRLSYANQQQTRPYAGSRWSMAPAQLFGQRLKARIAQAGGVVLAAADGATNMPVLRIEADDIIQNFDSSMHSSAQLAMRVSLLGGRSLLAQKTFSRQVAATSADAAGGAAAMAAASDALIDDIIDWLAGLPIDAAVGQK
ncbi:ABC-type transport auxiliary lipoprotein family protein [Undibacterium arcticum]|uniref:ABC-type transport auxiliary lipoprotein family protein n=1 Tax=Undibacterium arcticum TaxID=1762892 RepID=A0ABV7F193_9BURK